MATYREGPQHSGSQRMELSLILVTVWMNRMVTYREEPQHSGSQRMELPLILEIVWMDRCMNYFSFLVNKIFDLQMNDNF